MAPEDAGAVDAAIRETREEREEVGLDLTGARRLGALPEIPLVGRGRPLGGVVAPFATLFILSVLVFLSIRFIPATSSTSWRLARGLWHLRRPGTRGTQARPGPADARAVRPLDRRHPPARHPRRVAAWRLADRAAPAGTTAGHRAGCGRGCGWTCDWAGRAEDDLAKPEIGAGTVSFDSASQHATER